MLRRRRKEQRRIEVLALGIVSISIGESSSRESDVLFQVVRLMVYTVASSEYHLYVISLVGNVNKSRIVVVLSRVSSSFHFLLSLVVFSSFLVA